MENQSLIQWISVYQKLGWFLLPIVPGEKNPYIKWKHRRNQKPDLNEIFGWLKKWPKMNLGLATGQLSGVVGIDLDGLEGLTYGKQNQITSSVQSISGRLEIGKHIYYKWETEIHGSVSKIAPHVDLRGDGDIIILPPSQHKSGKYYRWERFIPSGLKLLPQSLIQQSFDVTIVGKEPGWISQALEEMKIGNIDETLVSILGRLRRDGWTESDARTTLLPHAIRAGATDGHLEEKIRNIWSRYEAGRGMPQIRNGIYNAQSGELSIHSPADDDSYLKFQSGCMAIDPKLGVKTGFPTLDKYFEGGLKSERLFTVAARTGTGKTNFAIALAANLCQQGKKVLFFSTEFQYGKVWSRIVPYVGSEGFRQLPFYVCDSFSPRIEQVEGALKRIMPDVFIFDHINHLGEEREGLGVFMQGCNFLQRKYNTQGVMVAQLNRQADWVEDGKRIEPRMSMIKGSGTIEQASSRVLLLSETRVTPEMCEIIGILDKNDAGERGPIHFALLKNPFKLVELP